jgi:preprotein translocase subunit YajC
LVYVVIIGAVMIFMTSRGRKKQQTQQLMMREALVVGVEARTIGGMVGEVVEVTDEHVILETTPGVKLKFVKTAIAGVISPATDEEPALDGADEDGEPEAEASDAGSEPADSASVDADETDHLAPAPYEATEAEFSKK